MRHLVGVMLAIVLAAVLFFAATWGYMKVGASRPGALPAGGGTSFWHDRAALEGFAALAATGLVAGLLIAAPRISPLGSGLPGLVLLAWTALYLSSAPRAVKYIPLKTHPYGAGFENLLFNGVLALAGLAMIIPLFVPSRWRRRYLTPSAPAVSEGDTTSYPDAQATQTMAGGSVFSSDWPATATRPQPRIDPKSQAPWGPAEYS
jgi:hypothetical protein